MSDDGVNQTFGAAAAPKEVKCKTCGEMVPVKSLRCWNCSSFMRDDIAQKAQTMRRNPTQVIYSDVPQTDVDEPESTYSLGTPDDTLDAGDAGDDDFELSPEISVFDELPEDEPAPEISSNGHSGTGEVEAQADETDQQTDDSSRRSTAPPEPAESHSVATGGDVLLDVALKEQAESAKRRIQRAKLRAEKRKISRPGFTFVFCPHGHRMEVPEKNRGRWGRCPKCHEPFHVPLAPWRDKQAEEEEAAEAAAAEKQSTDGSEVAAGKFARWMADIRTHVVNPEKLKLKAGSLVDDFELLDWGFAPDELLTVSLVKKGGFFGGGADPKKKEEARTAMYEHLRADNAIDKLPVASQQRFDLEVIEKMRVVYPVPEGDEPMFMGVPVFGEGRIWIRLPSAKGSTEMLFASLHLTEFRKFVNIMQDVYGISGLTRGINVPLTDEFKELKCQQFSNDTLYVLEDVTYHKVDPAIKLQVVGRKCQACGLIISEDSRKKEKIGGSAGKSIAKATCPNSKCGKKFGEISLYSIEGYLPASAEPASEQAAAE